MTWRGRPITRAQVSIARWATATTLATSKCSGSASGHRYQQRHQRRGRVGRNYLGEEQAARRAKNNLRRECPVAGPVRDSATRRVGFFPARDDAAVGRGQVHHAAGDKRLGLRRPVARPNPTGRSACCFGPVERPFQPGPRPVVEYRRSMRPAAWLHCWHR